MNIQTLNLSGKASHVVIPVKDYQRLVEAAESIEDVRVFDEAMAAIESGEETYPARVVEALAVGDVHPIKVFRVYRGISQSTLAKQYGASPAFVSAVETLKKNAPDDLLECASALMRVDIGLLRS